MIDQLRTMAIFQAVAESGTFRKAAKTLNLSPSVVSHHVSKLEQRLGTPLLYRSTRRISLTDAGAELLSASQRMTAAAIDGLAAIQRRAEAPSGKLTLTVASPMSHSPFAETFIRFAQSYPRVQLSIHVSDKSVSLEGSSFDLAIRGWTGDLDDSSYKARKLGQLELCLFASPAYTQARPPLKAFEDLADWDWIQSNPAPWPTVESSASAKPPKIAMNCDNYTMARKFVDAGLGFMVEAYLPAAEDIRAGRLVQLLPQVRLRPIDVYAIYPANSPKDSLAQLFVDFLVAQDWATEARFRRQSARAFT